MFVQLKKKKKKKMWWFPNNVQVTTSAIKRQFANMENKDLITPYAPNSYPTWSSKLYLCYASI